MTTVAAVAAGGQVLMAGDSRTYVYDRAVTTARKVLRVPVGEDGDSGDLLIGLSGDGALGDLLDADLTVPDVPVDTDEEAQAWAGAVARAITKLGVEAGLVEDGRLDTSGLLGYRGRLWHLTHGQAIRVGRYAAVGSGEGPAMGVLLLLDRLGQLAEDPGQSLLQAMDVAVSLDAHSDVPVRIEVA